MTILIVLLLLLLLFAGGGATYRNWGGNGPEWGGNVLWVLAVLVLVAVVLNLLGVLTYPHARP